MGAESLKSGFTESLKFLKKSLQHDQEIPADYRHHCPVWGDASGAKRLVWGDSRFGMTLPAQNVSHS
jgi:hypothetical protein